MEDHKLKFDSTKKTISLDGKEIFNGKEKEYQQFVELVLNPSERNAYLVSLKREFKISKSRYNTLTN